MVIPAGDTYTVKASATPSSAKVTFESADKSVATVSSKGVITGVAVGTTKVTAKATYGTKTVTKSVDVSVTNEIPDGITTKLTNAYSEDYPNVVVTNSTINKDQKAIVKFIYGRSNKPVENVILNIRYTFDGGKSYNTAHTYKTDASGVTYWEVPVTDVSSKPTKVSYTVTPEDDSTASKEGTFDFGTINIKAVQNVNGANGNDKFNADGYKLDKDYVGMGYGSLIASTNDINPTDSKASTNLRKR